MSASGSRGEGHARPGRGGQGDPQFAADFNNGGGYIIVNGGDGSNQVLITGAGFTDQTGLSLSSDMAEFSGVAVVPGSLSDTQFVATFGCSNAPVQGTGDVQVNLTNPDATIPVLNLQFINPPSPGSNPGRPGAGGRPAQR